MTAHHDRWHDTTNGGGPGLLYDGRVHEHLQW